MTAAPVSGRGVAVVTGGSRGLGRGIALALAGAGHDLVVNYVTDAASAAETVTQCELLGVRASAVRADVTDPESLDALVLGAAEVGPLEVWVNSAGVSTLAPLIETTDVEFRRMIDVNLLGAFHGIRAAARSMIAGGVAGRIVNVSSEVGVVAFRYLGAYAATKFGVVGLTQAAAIELADHGITVNAVGPGTAETDMVMSERRAEMAITGRSADEVRAGYLDAIPLGRFCEPADVGALVAWMVGPGASYVTGQIVCTNGGSVLH